MSTGEQNMEEFGMTDMKKVDDKAVVAGEASTDAPASEQVDTKRQPQAEATAPTAAEGEGVPASTATATTGDTPAQPDPVLAATDMAPAPSEDGLEWEKVEKPSPGKDKEGGQGVPGTPADHKLGGMKGAVGGVRKVLKSGVFGGSPRPSPAQTKPPIPKPTFTRPSLVGRKLGSSTNTKEGLKSPTEAAPGTPTSAAAKEKRTSRLFPGKSSTSTAPVTAKPAEGATKATTDAPKPPAKPRTSTLTRPTAASAAAAGRPLRTSTLGSSTKTAPAPPPKAALATTTRVTRSSLSGTAASSARQSPTESTGTARPSATTRTSSTAVSSAGATTRGASRASLTGRPAATAPVRAVRTGGAVGGKADEAAAKEIAELKTKVSELESQLEENKKSYEEKLEAQLAGTVSREEHEKHVSEAASAKDELQKQLDEATSKLSALQAEVDTAKAESANSSTKIVEAEAASTTLREQLATKSSEHDAIFKEKADLETQLKDGAAELEKILQEITTVEGSLKEAQTKIAGLEKELEEERGVKSAAEGTWTAEKKAMEGQISTHLADLEKHLGLAETFKTASEGHEENLRILQGQHDDLSSTYQALLATSSTHPEAIQALQVQLAEATDKHHAALQEATDTHKAMLSEIEGKRMEAESERADAWEELKTLKAGREESDKTLASLQEENSTLQRVKGELVTAIQGLEQALKDVQVKADEAGKANEEKYARAFEDAKASAGDHQAAELAAIRAQLTDTHAQLTKAHQAELEALEASHATSIADKEADHATALGSVRAELAQAKVAAQEEAEAVKTAQDTVEHLRSQIQTLELDLVEAKNAAGKEDAAGAEALKKAFREVEALKDELEGTKSVPEMNKTHFESSLEQLQADHSALLRSSAEEDAARSAKVEVEHKRALEHSKAELAELRLHVEDEKVAKKMLESDLAAHGETSAKLRAHHADEIANLKSTMGELEAEIQALRTAASKPVAKTADVATATASPKSPMKTPSKPPSIKSVPTSPAAPARTPPADAPTTTSHPPQTAFKLSDGKPEHPTPSKVPLPTATEGDEDDKETF